MLARLVVVALVAACQRTDPSPPPPAVATGSAAPLTAAYTKDIAAVCDAVRLSGSEQLPPGDRVVQIATWLPANLTTSEAHAFLVKIQPLVGEPKARALEAEARRVGLPGCALADEWR